MPKYIAFLRAINVGGHTVKMDDLRRLFEEMGFSNVKTFIASGNVIFDSRSKNAAALEKKIEEFLESRLGYKVATFVRSTVEVSQVAKYSPFKGINAAVQGPTLYIGFLRTIPAQEAGQKIQALSSKTDELHLSGKEIYWLCHNKLSDSKISYAHFEKLFGMQATFRNVTTVRKIAQEHCEMNDGY